MGILKMRSLFHSSVFFLMCVGLFGCYEDKNFSDNTGEGVIVGKIDEATLSLAKWQWGLVATSQSSGETSTFVCTTDTVYGGYLAMFQSPSCSLGFSFDNDFKVRHFSAYSIGYVVDYSDDRVYVMSTNENGNVYKIYNTAITSEIRDTPFESAAAAIKTFYTQIDVIWPWFTDAYSKLLDTVLNGDIGSLPVVANELYIENYDPAINRTGLMNMLQAMFGNAYPHVYGYSVKSSDH